MAHRIIPELKYTELTRKPSAGSATEFKNPNGHLATIQKSEACLAYTLHPVHHTILGGLFQGISLPSVFISSPEFEGISADRWLHRWFTGSVQLKYGFEPNIMKGPGSTV
ncbi:hypothetical protein AVEN_83300-1 [Araneus ventricosus]|uniref:Uncharacterized protein n=1 Tax=Araneus ventricosus TaxID=182803 RepID=A0A4Y2S9G2_ARAVE|nr:hypothetical protein AVEN_83300-1 [Araneus ventricosus]